jgi:hypothetical protein
MEKADSSSPDDNSSGESVDLPCPQHRSNTPRELLPGAAHHITEPASGMLASDILRGADEIAAFLFGDKRCRRKVYNLVESGSLPYFRLGASICARKSVLLAWIANQERGE